MRTPHSHFPKGRKVIVILRDGTQFVAKFWKNEDKGVVHFLDHAQVPFKKIRAMTYYRSQTE